MSRTVNGAACQNIDDLRRMARARLPRGVYDFFERGSEDEACRAGNRAGWAAVKLLPRVLRDVSNVDPSVDLFGALSAFPLAVAPTGAAGLLHYRGDLSLARAAAQAGVPFTISSASNMDIERIAEAGGRLWFQLYMFENRALSTDVLRRAADLGCDTLLVTTDIPVPSNREYNRRNGFGTPFKLTSRNATDILSHPGWFTSVMCRYLLNEGLPRQANLPAHLKSVVTKTAPLGARFRGDRLTWEEADRIRSEWPGKVLLKGILRPEDAERAVALGFDGVVVSNHGGRSLDSAPATAVALPAIVAAVGARMTVLVDSGITRGSDIAKALALGAHGVLAGRAPLYGLAVGGEAGVARALALLKAEFVTTMGLLGAQTVAEIDADVLA